MNNKILAFDGIRVMAFIFVFLSHIGNRIPTVSNYGTGINGVSVFIILSGFLAAYLHSEDKIDHSWKMGWNNYKKKFKKFFLVHLLTFLLAVVLQIYWLFKWFSYSGLVIAIVYAIINLTLLQSFFPNGDIYFSCNSVSWYLTDNLFFSFMTYPLLKLSKQLRLHTGGGVFRNFNYRIYLIYNYYDICL